MSVQKTIESLFDSLGDGIREVGDESKKTAKSTETLVEALERQNDSAKVSAKGLSNNNKALTKWTTLLIGAGKAQLDSAKNWHDLTRTTVRGTSLLGKTASESQKNVRMLQDSAVAYKAVTGATTEESLKMAASYQSTQKLMFGKFDEGADKYLKHVGQIGKLLGTSAEEMGQIQDDLLRKGRFSKDFAKSVGNMMLEGAEKYNLSVQESASVVGETIENSFYLDAERREKAAKMSLEGAAVSKKAAVDFGKYATSLVGQSGADRLKGVAKLSAMSGVDMDTVNEQLRMYEINKNNTDILETTLKAAKNITGVGENESFADKFQDGGATGQAVMEEILNKIGVAGNAINVADYERRMHDPNFNVDPKGVELSGKTPKNLHERVRQNETTQEMFNRGVAWVDKWTVKADDFVHKLSAVLEPAKGMMSGAGITTSMLGSMLGGFLTGGAGKAIVTRMGSSMARMMGGIKNMFKGKGGAGGGGGMFSGLKKWSSDLVTKSRSMMTGILGKSKTMMTGILGKSKTMMTGIFNSSKGFLANVVGKSKGLLSGLGGKSAALLGKGGATLGKLGKFAGPLGAAITPIMTAWKLKDEKSRNRVRAGQDDTLKNSRGGVMGNAKNVVKYLDTSKALSEVGLGLYDLKKSKDGVKSSQKALNAAQQRFIKKYGTLDFAEIRRKRDAERAEKEGLQIEKQQARRPATTLKPVEDRTTSKIEESKKELEEGIRIAKEHLSVSKRVASLLTPTPTGSLLVSV